MNDEIAGSIEAWFAQHNDCEFVEVGHAAAYHVIGPWQSDAPVLLTRADEFLAGDARKEYDLLFKRLQEKAPGQKLVLSAEVQVAAVKSLDADSAELLVFLDQASQRSTDKESAISAAQIAVEAAKVDGQWKVTALDLF
jgi:Mce-associated membrane protein